MYKVLRYKVLFTLFDPMEYYAQGADAQGTADTVNPMEHDGGGLAVCDVGA